MNCADSKAFGDELLELLVVDFDKHVLAPIKTNRTKRVVRINFLFTGVLPRSAYIAFFGGPPVCAFKAPTAHREG